jgi:hypothetical protein
VVDVVDDIPDIKPPKWRKIFDWMKVMS